MRLQSNGPNREFWLKNYEVEVEKLLEDSTTEGISICTKTIFEQGNRKESRFLFNVVKSNSRLSLISLEQILEEQKSEIFD